MTFPPELVYHYLRNLKNNYSSGADKIPSIFFKQLGFSLALPLSFIFNLSFQTSELPFDWLCAKVTPIFKNKGTPQSVSNYRPISLTSIACKVMERLIRDKLVTYFSNNNIISKEQHGFLTHKSTTTQLLQCVNDWSKSLDSKGWVDVIYLDIAKAFDSVSHKKLLHKLQNVGITGLMLKWIAAFLSNRSQTVNINGSVSNPVSVTSGVPQGSVLGPLLFLIYINELPDVVKNCKIKLFADDSKIYFMGKKGELANLLQDDLERVFEWCDSVQLSIALEKSAVLHLGSSHNPRANFVISNHAIPSVEEIKDLGVIMSSDFKFSKHCNKIAKNAYSVMHGIYRGFVSRDQTFLTNMYKTYCRPKLEYATPVFNPCSIENIKTLEGVQRCFTRRIPSVATLSYPHRLNQLNLESLELRRLKYDLVMVYKILNGFVDVDWRDFFTISQTKTRGHSFKLHKPPFNTNYRKFFFSIRCIDSWNSLPTHVVESKSIVVFRNSLDKLSLNHFLKVFSDGGV